MPLRPDRDPSNPFSSTPVPPHASAVPPRPEGRGTPQPGSVGRPTHVLPSRPDSQPSHPRQPERSSLDRPADHGPPNRYDNRGPPTDYGRSDRHSDPVRQREASPGRHGRPVLSGRTPERMVPAAEHREWSGRDARDYDDRTMRAPARDRAQPVRPPSVWNSRDVRDPRDQRERPDSRGHVGQPSMETRRMPSNSSQVADYTPHHRDFAPLQPHHGTDRGDTGTSRPLSTVPSPSADGPMVNPARAALINQSEHPRPEPTRPDRDDRRERGTRPQSPRRAEDRRGDDRPPSGYHGRVDMPREYRDERGLPLAPPVNRDRRDEPVVTTPTGPRGGRPEPSLPASASREIFQPPQPSRSSSRQNQDPNYGRLNQPSEAMPPSGPRSESSRMPEAQAHNLIRSNERLHTQAQPPALMPPSGPAASLPPGIHPSRLENIQRVPAGPALQTNMSMPPSGPRGPGRVQGPPLSSPVNRGPPTGPAATDRGLRGNERRNPLGAINSVLTQNAPPPERPIDRSVVPPHNPPVRGRGATRANGMVEGHGDVASPMPPPSHPLTPNSHPEAQHGRSSRAEHPSNRIEGAPQDDGKTEPRTHRESRRSERSGRERSRSSDRNDRRPDERSGRNGPTEKPPRVEGEDRGGRERRGGERDGSSRRDRERGDGERSNREPRESGRRDRGSRDDGRTSGRDERDRRSRGGGSSGGVTEDARKRTRDPQDQGQGHGDVKRRR
jgi:THO complex subunit 2